MIWLIVQRRYLKGLAFGSRHGRDDGWSSGAGLAQGSAAVRHFQILGANTTDQSVVWHVDVSAYFVARFDALRSSRSACSQSSTSRPCLQSRAR